MCNADETLFGFTRVASLIWTVLHQVLQRYFIRLRRRPNVVSRCRCIAIADVLLLLRAGVDVAHAGIEVGTLADANGSRATRQYSP